MYSDESKEWYEKEAKWEKGKGAAVNWGGLQYIALKSQKDKRGSERRRKAGTESGIFGMWTFTDI